MQYKVLAVVLLLASVFADSVINSISILIDGACVGGALAFYYMSTKKGEE